MSRTALPLAALALLTVVAPAPAFGWRHARTAYYVQAPVLVAAAPAVVCVPAAAYVPTVLAPPPARPLAQPVAAPPSRGPVQPPRTQEPPLNVPAPPTPAQPSRGPGVTESRSYFNAYTVASADVKPAADHCRVSFWNLTERPVTVKVGDHSYAVASNSQSESLELQRQFVWRVDEREPQSERVADGQTGLVIVIRR